jgi:hypothetical protein
MKLNKIVLLCLLLLLVLSVTNLYADDTGTSTSPGAFLNMPIGTNAIAMGGTYVAIAEGSESIFHNPAGLLKIKFPFLTLNGDILGIVFDGTFNGYASFAMPPSETGKIGWGVGVRTSIAYDAFDEYDPSGNPLSENISNFTIVPQLSLAIRQSLVNSGDGIGITLKGIFSRLNDTNGFGGGIDVGVLSNIAMFTFGIKLQDLFTVIKYTNRDLEFVSPRAILGIAYKNIGIETKKTTMAISLQIDKALLHNGFTFSLGGMFQVWEYNKVSDDDVENIDNIIGNLEDEEEEGKFGTALYILGGYNFRTLSLGLTFTLDPINMKLDVATQFPTKQGETFSLYTTLEFHF